MGWFLSIGRAGKKYLDLAPHLPTNILLVHPISQDQLEASKETQEIILVVYLLEHRALCRRSENESGEIWMHTLLSFLLNSQPMEEHAHETERQRFNVQPHYC